MSVLWSYLGDAALVMAGAVAAAVGYEIQTRRRYPQPRRKSSRKKQR